MAGEDYPKNLKIYCEGLPANIEAPTKRLRCAMRRGALPWHPQATILEDASLINVSFAGQKGEREDG